MEHIQLIRNYLKFKRLEGNDTYVFYVPTTMNSYFAKEYLYQVYGVPVDKVRIINIYKPKSSVRSRKRKIDQYKKLKIQIKN